MGAKERHQKVKKTIADYEKSNELYAKQFREPEKQHKNDHNVVGGNAQCNNPSLTEDNLEALGQFFRDDLLDVFWNAMDNHEEIPIRKHDGPGIFPDEPICQSGEISAPFKDWDNYDPTTKKHE